MTKAATKVAIYARLSSEDGREAGAKSVDRQVALAREFSARKGWFVGETYVDENWSGADFTRPGLVRMLEAARQAPRPSVT
jgi:DNA invertase Pin-like site-specific DNA recombinase